MNMLYGLGPPRGTPRRPAVKVTPGSNTDHFQMESNGVRPRRIAWDGKSQVIVELLA